MERLELLGPRVVVLFLAGSLLFGYPILDLFSRDAAIAGVPVLYVYLFATWLLFIALIALVAESDRRRR